MAPRINTLHVRNLRSISAARVSLRFPERGALILVGENNSGKSNITRALDVLFGDVWPSSRQMEEHDFYGRDSDGIAIEIGAEVSGIPCGYCQGEVTYLSWTHDSQERADDGSPVAYRFRCDSCSRTFPKREMRAALAATGLDADRRLDYQLSYASKYTMLSKLMHRFHERLLSDSERKNRLVAGFRQLIGEFRGVREFDAFHRLLAEASEDFGQNLPYRLDIDFSAYDPSNFFRSLRVQPSFSGEVRTFDELGTGQSQVLSLAFAYAYAKAYGRSEGMILVIDEPESNLHPLAQQWLASRLDGLVTDGLQVVLTTHSPHFVNLAKPENLVLVSKPVGEATRTVQRTLVELRDFLVARGANAERTRAETIGPFYSASATTEIVSGLFARRCVLVEGATEALALPELLRLRGFHLLRDGIAVVPVEGVGNIAKWLRLYTALGIECFCVFDTDSDKVGRDADDLLAKRRDIMAALGLDPSLADVGSMSAEPLAVSERFATLNPNFEGAAATLFGQRWADLLNEAAPIVGDSKPLRARYAAGRLDATQLAGPVVTAIDALARRVWGGPLDSDGAAAPPNQSSVQSRNPSATLTRSAPPAQLPTRDASPDPWASEPAPSGQRENPWLVPSDEPPF